MKTTVLIMLSVVYGIIAVEVLKGFCEDERPDI